MTTTERDLHRRRLLEIAQAVAPGWERQRARIEEAVAPVRAWLVEALAPRPGDALLELAAGVGDTGFEALARAGRGGRLISTDLSVAMVDAARRRGAQLGLDGVDYLVMDAERIELEDESVDGVLCRFGYMLMADPPAALGETRRVLRRGGRLALAVWSAPADNPWLTSLAATLVELGHVPPPEPGGPDPFSMGSAQRSRSALEAAGFRRVRTAEVPVSFDFRDMADYVAYAADTAGPLAPVLTRLSDRERSEVAAALEQACAPFATADGYALPGRALTAVAD